MAWYRPSQLLVNPDCCQSSIFRAQALLTLSLADVQPASAVLESSSLTQVQLREAEELYNMIRKRTGQEPPQIMSAPNLKVGSHWICTDTQHAYANYYLHQRMKYKYNCFDSKA
jgi:hypothetical protein